MKNINELTFIDLIKKPYFFNQVIKSTSNRYLHYFLQKVKQQEIILDVGCGKISVIPNEYKNITCDFLHTNNPDVVGTVLKLPFKDDSVDYLCASWMFEHVEEPTCTLLEFCRVIKPGGYLYLTTNFCWHIHERPRDFFRFTEFGLKYLFEKYGNWEIQFLKASAGFWITILQMLNYKISSVLGMFHPVATIPLQISALYLEKINFDNSVVAGYCIIAKNKKQYQA